METIEFTYKGEKAYFTFVYLGINFIRSLRVECDHSVFRTAMNGLLSVKCDSVIRLCDDHMKDDPEFFGNMKRAFKECKSLF